ncbi:MAG: glycerophosphodiester phosphodiesterase [Gammaproteobacteria bacterium]|nr:MAG: glycerophosphodiester phosphodiesterase [Gammaproteobacteria bacterium]
MRKPRLLCIGHRGAMGHAPENTLRSIRKALELGTTYIEIDVYYVDGHIVVFHDDRLERTTNGAGYMCEQSFNYLRSLDAGHGQRIPTLEEVCEVIDSRASLNIELKEPGAAAPVAELLSTLIDDGWDKNRFLVSSVHHDELLQMKRLSQQTKLGVLIRGAPVDDSKFAADLGAFSVHPSLDFVDQKFVDDAHSRGLKVFVYTVNQAEDIARMQGIGVDGVFTGFPERVLENYAQGDTASGWN